MKKTNLVAFLLTLIIYGSAITTYLQFPNNNPQKQIVIELAKLDLTKTITIAQQDQSLASNPKPEPAPKPTPKPEPTPKPKPPKQPVITENISENIVEPKLTKQTPTITNPTDNTVTNSQNAIQTATIKTIYLNYIHELIRSNKTYPKAAQRRRHQEETELLFTLLADGSFTNIRLSKKTAHNSLNNATLGILKKIKQVKAFPPELTPKTIQISIEIEYKL